MGPTLQQHDGMSTGVVRNLDMHINAMPHSRPRMAAGIEETWQPRARRWAHETSPHADEPSTGGREWWPRVTRACLYMIKCVGVM